MDAAQPAGSPHGLPPGSAGSTGDHDRDGRAAGVHDPAPAEAANDGVLDSAKHLWNDFTALAKDHLELALLETQRAGKSAVNMLIYAVGAALLLITAWLGLLAALVIGLAELGLHPGFGALIVVGLNLIGAYVLYRMIRSSSENLRFPATMRSFKGRTPDVAPDRAASVLKPMVAAANAATAVDKAATAAADAAKAADEAATAETNAKKVASASENNR